MFYSIVNIYDWMDDARTNC